MKAGALVAGVLLFSAPPLRARPALDVHVYPSVAAAPATVAVRMIVPPDAGNHAVAVAVDSGDFFRSSEVPLDGDRAPRSIFLEYRGLPPGSYEVRGVLVGSDGKELASAETKVIVTGLGGR